MADSTVLVLTLAAKSTLVLLAGAGASRLARRRSAAVRHALWCTALFSAASIPLVSPILPSWRAGILGSEESLEPPSEIGPAAAAAEFATPEPNRPASADPASGASPPSPPISIGAVALAIWIAGSVAATARAALALARTSALVAAARPLSDPATLAALNEAARSIGVGRSVVLAESPRARTALAAGFRRPIVILPPRHREWPAARLRAVLLHELAHVRRGDFALHVAARIASALLFFHPLARLAFRRIEALREDACDDVVLAAGSRPTEYAGALLEAAREFRDGRFAVAMARPFPVESRIAAILDASRERRALARKTPRRLASTALVSIVLVASLDPRPADANGLLAPNGAAVATRWSDGRLHAGAFLRGGVRFAPGDGGIAAVEPGSFLLVAARDAATGEISSLLATSGPFARPRVVLTGDERLFTERVLPETARRLRAAFGSPVRDPRISGSTLTGESAVTSDGDGSTVLARFGTERGPAGVFASGSITLSSDGRSVESMSDEAFLVTFVENDLPAIALFATRDAETRKPLGAAERDILAAALPFARLAVADRAPDVFLSN